MEQKLNGLSPDLIVHPGLTIKEILEDRNMSQLELAIKSGFSAKHVSEVINGKKDISSRFAHALEIVFNIPTSFWINLQGIYDKKIIELENLNNVNEEEYNIIEEIKSVVNYCENKNIIPKTNNKTNIVLIMRKFLGITNLTNIDKLSYTNIAYRKSKSKINEHVLYAWQKLCEYYADKIDITEEYEEFKIVEKIPEIKQTMFMEPNEMIVKLQEIFASCGISFVVVKHFTGAPVQGYIQKRSNRLILCMTIRQSYSDIFWFTLFHEIGHILNNDFDNTLFDFESSNNDIETRADMFASNMLIDEEAYKEFINSGNYKSISKIKSFADSLNIIPSIVIGRLNKELNDYSFMSKYKVRYKWKD